MIGARPAIALAAAWAIGAASSIGVGMLALSLVGGAFEDGPSRLPTTDAFLPAEPPSAAVSPVPSQRRPSQPQRSRSASARATAAPTRGGSGGQRLLTSAGGSVVARCDDAGAYLVYWTPAQGYRAENVLRGPADTVRLRFAARAGEDRVAVQCVNGVPRRKIEYEPHEREAGDH